MATQGIPYDAVAGVCRSHDVRDWCRRQGVQNTFRANYSVYGGRAGGIICRAWCHRMQYYYNLHLTSPQGEDL
eukprot:3435890-Lingulodinium_polyedra.AAC.1